MQGRPVVSYEDPRVGSVVSFSRYVSKDIWMEGEVHVIIGKLSEFCWKCLLSIGRNADDDLAEVVSLL